ncbi:hypothetical protein HN903_02220 [archaeon]|nr:hypothetical protein [archaeon]MBT7128548.1 hypothetical protein [archaeon]
MKLLDFIKPSITKIILTIIGLFLIPAMGYQNRCLIEPCGKTLRPLIVHLVKGINIDSINFPSLIIGIILIYILSSLIVAGSNVLIRRHKR